jgi:hypothetical protein
MGYRGKLSSGSRRASCGAPGCRMSRSPAASASPRAACRCGSATCRSTRSPPAAGRRRGPNALRRRRAEIDRLVAEGRERIGRLSERELLLLAAAVLRHRRVLAARPPLPARGPRPGRHHRLLVVGDRNPPPQFGEPYRAVPDPSIRHTKHVHGCATVSYSCSPTHRTIMGLVRALLSGAAIPG